MQANLKLGKIFGIPIGLNASWFIIFGLFTFSLATGYFPAQNPDFPFLGNIFLGFFASLLLFASVLAHELGHAYIAIRNKIPVRQINLFLLGGVAQIEQEPKSAGAEFRIAIAGPIVSIILALIFGGLSLLDQVAPAIATPSAYLARANLYLTAFNLLPGFPLDGGRVLRAIIWKYTADQQKATRIATISGQAVAYGLIGFGVFTAIVQRNIVGGMWLGFIGLYLRNAAVATQRHSKMEQSLQGITVSQVMNKNIYFVPNLISLQQLVDEYILSQGKKQFIVTNINYVLGYLTANNVYKIASQKWPFITTQQAMIPIEQLSGVRPDMQLTEALESVQNSDLDSIPVIDNNTIVGIISQEDVFRYLRLRTQFST